MFTLCILFQIGWSASVSAVLESPLAHSLDVGVPAMLRRQVPRGEETQRWEIREAGNMVASRKHAESSRIQLQAGSSPRGIVSFLDLETPPHVRALLEQNKYDLQNLGLEGRTDPVEATLKSAESGSGSDERVFTVACDANWTVVGGGCLGRQATDQVQGSRDLTVNAFKCESITDPADGDYTKKTFAICAESCATLLHDTSAHNECPATSVSDADGELDDGEEGVVESAPGGDAKKVIDPHHICSQAACSWQECCKTAPKCSTFFTSGGTCSGALPLRKPDHTNCSAWTCSIADCCGPAEMCSEWGLRKFPTSEVQDYCKEFDECLINIGDFSSKACTGTTAEPGLCTKVECCTAGATCATFDGSAAGCVHDETHAEKPHDTCCDESCTCNNCYAGGYGFDR